VRWGSIANPRSIIPALLQSTRRTVLYLNTSKVPVRAGFQRLAVIRSEGKDVSRSNSMLKELHKCGGYVRRYGALFVFALRRLAPPSC